MFYLFWKKNEAVLHLSRLVLLSIAVGDFLHREYRTNAQFISLLSAIIKFLADVVIFTSYPFDAYILATSVKNFFPIPHP